MKYYGKLVGAVIGGLILRHPLGIAFGAALGHAFDAGWLGGGRAAETDLSKAYRTLGVSPDADDEALERAYRKLISQYHPDKVAGAGQEIRSMAEQRSREINVAWERIRKPRSG